MSPLHSISTFAIFILHASETSDISVNNFDQMIDITPTGRAYDTFTTRSRLECSTLCSTDPKCSSFTAKKIGQGVGCVLYTCWEANQFSTQTGTTTFNKKVNDPILCPTGFSLVCNHCYYYHTTRLDWEAANTYCTSSHLGAYTSEVNSREENDFLNSLVDDYKNWLGGKLSPTHTWTWVHTTQDLSDGYQNWASGRPDGSGNCLMMHLHTGTWFDWSCASTGHVVCEYG